MKHSTCFERSFRPSSRAQDCTTFIVILFFLTVYLTVVNNSVIVWSTHSMDLLHRDGDKFPIVKPKRCTCYLKLFIFVKHSTCFGRFFSSIIRSSRLHKQRQAFVKQLLLPAVSGDDMELQSNLIAASGK